MLQTSRSTSEGCGERALIEAALKEAALLPPVYRPAVAVPESFNGIDLVREIHRGAQGVVFEAVKSDTGRRVAVKVTRDGPFADPRDQVRFEREIRILGSLRHPHIVNVHSSGSVSGHYFYVMDYIAGHPLDVWMRGSDLSVDDTLRLFEKICGAVATAHLHGVIHRDLKPGNIVVDEDDEPHVLDFGLAKLTVSETTVNAAQPSTATGQFLGSMPWASPEQIAGPSEALDVRSDVYSLGVLLYQMLTDRFPYPVYGPVPQVIGHILNTDPRRPSSIRRDVNDEADTIALKCLQKAPERRYHSAVELAEDVHRYLAGEPITAKADSGLYVLRKSLARHRGPVILTSLAVVLLGTGVGLAYHSVTQNAKLDKASKLVAEGRELQELNQFALAGSRYDAALSLVPDFYEAIGHKAFLFKEEYCNKEYTFREKGLLEESLRFCDQAMRMRPGRAGLWNLRGTLMYHLGDFDEAEAAFNETLRLKPDYYFAHSNLGRVHALRHEFHDALAAVQAGLVYATRDADAKKKHLDGIWRTLGSIQLFLGDPAAAHSLEMTRQIDRRDARNLLMLSRLHLTLPAHLDVSQALEEAEQARAYTGMKDPRFSRILAQALVMNSRFEDAQVYAEVALAEGDEPAYPHALMAAAAAGLGQGDSAQEHLQAVLDNWPAGFRSGETAIISAEKEFLWFDTVQELQELLQRAGADRAAD